MNKSLRDCFNDAVWIAKSIFERGKTAGSSGNISFRYENRIFISGGGTCFGTLTENDFAELNVEGVHIAGYRASKEAPLHLAFYKRDSTIGAVIHTHSFFTTLWSCYINGAAQKIIPAYTPYLEMKLGQPGLIPYAPPGSKALFDMFEKFFDNKRGYILANHGPIVGGGDLFEAFYSLEELEESARLSWELRNENIGEIA